VTRGSPRAAGPGAALSYRSAAELWRIRVTDHGELDATWHEQRLIVGCDGFAAHGTREAVEDDRAPDRALTTAAWRVVRITWRQLRDDGDVVARQLAALLG
jgi:very-short-patch-repair endonuclease